MFLKFGPAEAVDRLGVISHGHHIVVGHRQQPNDLRLEMIRILILVDHDVTVTPGEMLGEVRTIHEKVAQANEEIVVVQELLGRLVCRVLLTQAQEIVTVLEEMGVSYSRAARTVLRPG